MKNIIFVKTLSNCKYIIFLKKSSNFKNLWINNNKLKAFQVYFLYYQFDFIQKYAKKYFILSNNKVVEII